MFRKISLFLVLVLVIGALSACASAGLGTNQLSKEKKAEIEEAWYARISPSWRWAADGDTNGCRYYGNFGGYDILFFRGEVSTAALTTIRVGESSFFYTSGFNMFAYKDETLYVLKELYEDGKISADAVAKAAQYHKSDGKHLSLSDEVKSKIEWAMVKLYYSINLSAKEGTRNSVRYYGNYEGYEVFMIYPRAKSDRGGYTLFADTRLCLPEGGCLILAYKDQDFFGIGPLYEEGKLSKETAAAIINRHNEFDNENKNGKS